MSNDQIHRRPVTGSRMRFSSTGHSSKMDVAAPIDIHQQLKPPTGDTVGHGAVSSARGELIVIAFATLIFVGSIFSPPSLMDDVDAVQAQISRNMIQSGDWITARVDGVPYMEKAPL